MFKQSLRHKKCGTPYHCQTTTNVQDDYASHVIFYCNSKVLSKRCTEKIEIYLPNPPPPNRPKHLRHLHDNTQAHKACIVTELFFFNRRTSRSNSSLPPYSPDLAPCDYFLFPKLIYHLCGRRYHSRNSL